MKPSLFSIVYLANQSTYKVYEYVAPKWQSGEVWTPYLLSVDAYSLLCSNFKIQNKSTFCVQISKFHFCIQMSIIVLSWIIIIVYFLFIVQWYEELQQVSFENDFPMERAPLINTSMEFTSSYTRIH